jgi:serine/threonine protein kinase
MMSMIDRQAKINLTSTLSGYQFKHQGKDYKFPTLEKVHEFFFTETKLDTVKLCYQGKKSYVHFSIDEIETFTSKKALRRTLSQESEGAWIEKRDGKKKYFVDNGWLFSSIKKVSKEEYQNRPEKGSPFQKVLGVALGLYAIGSKMPHSAKSASYIGLLSQVMLFPIGVQAQVPLGGEFVVNTVITDHQDLPAIARLENGGFVTVWEGTQTGDFDIYVQIFNAMGGLVGSEFRCNTVVTGAQYNPAVSGLLGGGFVIAWRGDQAGDQDIYARIYNATGGPLGSEFRCNTITTGNQYDPAVVGLMNGNFVTAWTSSQTGNPDIYARIYNVTGGPLGSEFRCNTDVIITQAFPTVADLSGTGFIVAWDGDQTGDHDIYAQIYNQTGGPLGSEFRCNTNQAGDQVRPRAASLFGGGFVTVWYGDQTGDRNIYAQIYNQTGGPLGSEFRCNTNVTDFQWDPAVSGVIGGGFVTVWRGRQSGDYDIYAQVYSSIGMPVSSEFRCNTNLTDNQYNPTVTGLIGGGFVVVWNGLRSGSFNDIYGQRYNISEVPMPQPAPAPVPVPAFLTSSPTPSLSSTGTSGESILPPTSTPFTTQTPSFSISTTFSSSANSLGSNPSSISAIASSILSTSSEASSVQMASLTNTNSQQTPIPTPPSSFQNPTQTITFPPSQLSTSINPFSPTSSPISSFIPAFSAPSVFLTSNPSISSSPDSSSEVTCDQDCVVSYTDLIGGVLGGVLGVITVAGGIFAIYKCKNRNKNQDGDIESIKETHSSSVKLKNTKKKKTSTEQAENIQENTHVPLDKLDGFDPLPEELKQSHPAATFKVGDFPSIAEVSFKEVEQRGGRIIESEKGNQYKLLDSITRKEELSILQVTAAEVQFVKPKERSSPYLGKGQHGVVRIAQDIKTNKYVAVKEIRNTPEVPNAIEISAREGEILQQLEGVPNIIPLYGEYYVKSEMVLYQFMYLAGFGDGSLLAQKLRNQSKRVKNAILVEAAKELLQGVIGMQERHIYHFDLKPSNFMFDKVGTLYIVDFGSAIELEKGVLNEYVYADAYYFSPERIELSRTEYNNRTTGIIQPIDPISAEKSEGWSLGVSLLEMINGHNSFIGKDPVLERDEDFFKRILQKELKQIDAPDEIAVIIRGLLITDPSERMSVLEAYGKIQNISLFKDPEEKARVFASMKGLEQE